MKDIREEAERFSLYLQQLGYVKVVPCEQCINRVVDGEYFVFRCKKLNNIEVKETDYCVWAEGRDNG